MSRPLPERTKTGEPKAMPPAGAGHPGRAAPSSSTRTILPSKDLGYAAIAPPPKEGGERRALSPGRSTRLSEPSA